MVEIDPGDSELARAKHQIRLDERRISQLEHDLRQLEAERDAAIQSAGAAVLRERERCLYWATEMAKQDTSRYWKEACDAIAQPIRDNMPDPRRIRGDD